MTCPPAPGVTAISQSGVTHIRHCDLVLVAMEAQGQTLVAHGEEKEPVFYISRALNPTFFLVTDCAAHAKHTGRHAVISMGVDKHVAWRLVTPVSREATRNETSRA